MTAIRLGAAALCTVLIGIASTGAAIAAWSSSGTGQAAGAAAVMPAGSTPAGSATGTSVSVRWSAATLPGGTPVAGYIVHRYNSVNGAAATVGAGCSGVVTTTTCTESSVPAGTWIYTDTPVLQGWTGAESPASAPFTVV